MKKVNNDYADYYYLLEEGIIYNAVTNKLIQPNKEHAFILKTNSNKRKKVSLKTLYKLVYNKTFCKDNIYDLENEQWEEIDSTEGIYYISNKGRVKSLHGYEAIILKPFCNKGGYARVDIIENGMRRTKLIHRLVAAAFLPFPQKIDMQLHHKDFDKGNNTAENLEWLSPAAHAEKHKLHNMEESKIVST